jgi:hypothetical protein
VLAVSLDNSAWPQAAQAGIDVGKDRSMVHVGRSIGVLVTSAMVAVTGNAMTNGEKTYMHFVTGAVNKPVYGGVLGYGMESCVVPLKNERVLDTVDRMQEVGGKGRRGTGQIGWYR